MQRIVKSKFFYQIAERIIPLLSWLMITFPLWFSPFHPAVVSYFILLFMLYFLYKSVKTVYYAVISYKLINQAAKINWHKRLLKTNNYQNINHFLIITNYKESVDKMEKTLEKIKDQAFPMEKVSIVLAMEKREGEEAKKRAEILGKKFSVYFNGFYTIYHELSKNEIIGKASNESCAAKFIYKNIKEKNINPQQVLITVCDADSLLPKDYLAYLTCEYLKDRDRNYHFYWAPVLLYNNFWQLSLPVRVQSTLSSVLRLSFLSQKDDLIQISTYSTNLWLLNEVGYWDVDIIPEDWHIWLQAFFKFGGKVKTLPIYLPICADAVLTKGLFKTFKNRYEQEKRWAWGASDIPYAIKKSFETPKINLLLKLKKIFQLSEAHLMWPTTFFIVTISASIPSLINPIFKRTVMGFFLPKSTSVLLTITSLLLLFFLYFDYKLREKVKIKTRLVSVPLLFIQWYFLPLISFLFSSLPALEAHTRMLMGKRIEYKVTEKI